jgi:hypothetical protein
MELLSLGAALMILLSSGRPSGFYFIPHDFIELKEALRVSFHPP